MSLFRSEDLDGDGSDSDLSSSPSAQDLESYKLLYEIATTIGRYGNKRVYCISLFYKAVPVVIYTLVFPCLFIQQLCT